MKRIRYNPVNETTLREDFFDIILDAIHSAANTHTNFKDFSYSVLRYIQSHAKEYAEYYEVPIGTVNSIIAENKELILDTAEEEY